MNKLLWALVLPALLLASCHKENADSLLKTIPSTSPMVAVVNYPELQDQISSKNPQENFQSLLNAGLLGQRIDILHLKEIFGEGSPIDKSTPVVFFSHNRSLFLTFAVTDDGAFRDYMEKATSSRFAKHNSVWELDGGTLFVCGKQAWSTADYPEVTAENIHEFVVLPESKSLVSAPQKDYLSINDADIAIVMAFSDLISASEEDAKMMMGLNMIFESPRMLAVRQHFEASNAEAELFVLNAKGERSKASVTAAPIDFGALKNFKARGDVFIATAIDKNLTSMLSGQLAALSAFAPSVSGLLKGMEGNLIAVVDLSKPTISDPPFTMGVTYASPALAAEGESQLAGMVRSFGNDVSASVQGDMVVLRNGESKGSTELSEVVDCFRDAVFCVVAVPSESSGYLGKPETLKDVKRVIVKSLKDASAPTFTITLEMQPGKSPFSAL